MKNTIKALLIAGSVLFTFSAGAQKLAHLNVDSLMKSMPEYDTAKKVIQAHYNDLISEVESMNKELQAKADYYKAHQAEMTPLIKANNEDEMNQMNQRIQAFQQNAQQDMQKFQDSLTKPIINKARAAINTVAKEHHYEYVFDSSSGILVYFDQTDDIYSLVADKLGIVAKKTK
jgi:outer membrane protein